MAKRNADLDFLTALSFGTVTGGKPATASELIAKSNVPKAAAPKREAMASDATVVTSERVKPKLAPNKLGEAKCSICGKDGNRAICENRDCVLANAERLQLISRAFVDFVTYIDSMDLLSPLEDGTKLHATAKATFKKYRDLVPLARTLAKVHAGPQSVNLDPLRAMNEASEQSPEPREPKRITVQVVASADPSETDPLHATQRKRQKNMRRVRTLLQLNRKEFAKILWEHCGGNRNVRIDRALVTAWEHGNTAIPKNIAKAVKHLGSAAQ